MLTLLRGAVCVYNPKSTNKIVNVCMAGNAGSRVDALPLLPILLPAGISVFAFDFAGPTPTLPAFRGLGFQVLGVVV